MKARGNRGGRRFSVRVVHEYVFGYPADASKETLHKFCDSGLIV
jgi:hypothetical protein